MAMSAYRAAERMIRSAAAGGDVTAGDLAMVPEPVAEYVSQAANRLGALLAAEASVSEVAAERDASIAGLEAVFVEHGLSLTDPVSSPAPTGTPSTDAIDPKVLAKDVPRV